MSGHCGPFGAFSSEITELAEVVVEAAVQRAWQQLQEQHGIPMTARGVECQFTVAALGKFGGVEMGFASDIEMYAVYDSDGTTTGRASISAASFFERLVNRVTQTIEARHKGIFEIDLRMRPYGQAGSAAVSLNTFQKYFASNGDAWPYERQSLVKMRCIAGNADFGARLMIVRDKIFVSKHAV